MQIVLAKNNNFLTAEKILRRWKNWRTDYGKLRRWVGKTGQGARKKSVLQQWKLRALAFLDPYILRRGSGSEMGRVSISIDSVCVTFSFSHFTYPLQHV